VRHLVFHPNGQVVYAINEMASSVTAFHYDKQAGALEELQTVSTIPDSFTGANSGAEIAINAAGTRVYASNRGQDTIALLAVDPVSFTLSAMEYAPSAVKKPRGFAFDPAGTNLVVAGQDSNTIMVFRVHPRTGQLQPLGRGARNIVSPTSVVFVPMG
jgi:6-phosphogluconolactonase